MGAATIKKIDLEELGRHLEEKGYKVENLRFSREHILGDVFYENEKQFFKMVISEKMNDNLENEKKWCGLMNGPWRKYTASFKSPKILDEGNFQGNNWLVREYVFGTKLVPSEKEIEKVVEIINDIRKITDLCLLPNDLKMLSKITSEKLVCNHGSLIPENIIKTKKNEYFLIDAENACVAGKKRGDMDTFGEWLKKNRSTDLANLFLEKTKMTPYWRS